MLTSSPLSMHVGTARLDVACSQRQTSKNEETSVKNDFRLSILSVCIGAMCASADAQTPTQEAETSSLDTVVITAQKRKEKLQETPLSITALSATALEHLNVVNVNTLQNAIPNILFLNVGSNNAVTAYIRSIGTANAVFTQDPAIGLYVDDVYLARSLGANRDFFDVERVEVLRGPQGTLYGSNSPAGAIRVVTSKPDLKAGFEGKIEATLGNYKAQDLNVAMNLPIVDGQTAARLVLMSAQHAGYQKNLTDGSEGNTNNTTGARLHLASKIGADWDVLLSLDTTKSRAKPNSAVSYFAGAPGSVDLFNQPGFNKRDFNSEKKAVYDNLDGEGYVVDLHGSIVGADLRFITAYRKLDEGLSQDVDGLNFNAFSARQDLKNTQFTQELNLGGVKGNLTWLVGAYSIRETSDFLWDVDYLAGLGAGLVVPPGHALEAKYTTFDQTKSSWSLFTQETLKLSDKTTFTGGLRWTEETKDFHATGYRKTNYVDFGLPPGTLQYDERLKKTWSAPQWRFGLDHKLNEDALVFATAARGFRSGGFNGGARSKAEATGSPFDPEYATTYEIGAKTEWMNRKLRLNVTAFQTEYKDQQVAYLNTGGVFGTSTINSSISGVELEATMKPIQGLTLFANLGTLDGSTNSNATLFAPNAKYQYTVGFNFSRPARDNLIWFVGANYFRTAEYDASVQHDPFRLVPSYSLLGARMGFGSNDDRWKLELIGTNLQDTYTPLFGFNIPGLNTQVRYANDPSLVKMKLTVNF